MPLTQVFKDVAASPPASVVKPFVAASATCLASGVSRIWGFDPAMAENVFSVAQWMANYLAEVARLAMLVCIQVQAKTQYLTLRFALQSAVGALLADHQWRWP